MDSSNRIDYILQHITSLLTRDSDQILLEQLGIGYSQYKILRVLNLDSPVKQKFISGMLGQTEASVSRQIDLLIDKSLITKVTDRNNKRVRLIRLTQKGKKISDATTNVLNKYHKSALSGFGDKKQNELLKLLEELHSKLCTIEHGADADYFNYLTQS